MKKILFVLLALGSFSSCHGQKGKMSDYINSLGNGYYSISNRIDGKLLLPNYQNYKNSNDSIFLEKINYQFETANFLFLIGNMFGSKSSIILALKKEKEKCDVVFAKEIALIDTTEKVRINDFNFFLLSSHGADMCSEWDGISIYVLYKMKIYKSFDGIKKEVYYNTNDSLCERGVSYTQNFRLKKNNNEVLLIAEKKSNENKKSKVKEYSFKNYHFK